VQLVSNPRICRQARLLPTSGDGRGGPAHALSKDGRWAISPVWTRDGSGIVYLSGDTGGRQEVRKLAVFDSKRSERLADVDGDAFQLSLNTHLIYSRETGDTNIWRASIDANEASPATGHVLIASTRHDWHPRYSPDGRMIAFGSTRSGSREIWIAQTDGSSDVQLTSFGGRHVGFMNWSPDSQRVVFHGRADGQADLFTMGVNNGGSPVRVTTDSADDVQPSYGPPARNGTHALA
jgi:Tol biopolymer transport system component